MTRGRCVWIWLSGSRHPEGVTQRDGGPAYFWRKEGEGSCSREGPGSSTQLCFRREKNSLGMWLETTFICRASERERERALLAFAASRDGGPAAEVERLAQGRRRPCATQLPLSLAVTQLALASIEIHYLSMQRQKSMIWLWFSVLIFFFVLFEAASWVIVTSTYGACFIFN